MSVQQRHHEWEDLLERMKRAREMLTCLLGINRSDTERLTAKSEAVAEAIILHIDIGWNTQSSSFDSLREELTAKLAGASGGTREGYLLVLDYIKGY